MKGLSKRQALIMYFIKATKKETGLAPTYREIAAYMGIKSANGVKRHLELLERKGYIHVIPYRARGIEIMEAKA